jgi:hypothetical protein
MSTTSTTITPARTHAHASELLRRPFAPGAIGFRAMYKTPLGDNPYGGAHVAAYLAAQSVVGRLNCVVPGRWRQQFAPIAPELHPAHAGEGRAAGRIYLACRLILTLPLIKGGPDVEAHYEDIGELDAGSLAGLKALYSDARKRAAVAAGIGAYLATALESVVLPIGPGPRQVQAIRRPGKGDLLVLSEETEQWLRQGYRARMESDAVRRDLGAMLAHGEPETGVGQGESAELPAPEATAGETPAPAATAERAEGHANGSGELVAVDFGRLGPAGPDAA